ncbi:MAG: 1,4-dihydroxy-2-naphthoate octaprenyltransferase [Candidatus Eisenbacteria bacterium]
MGLSVWLRVSRAPFLSAAAVPVILGGALGWHRAGLFHWPHFLLTLLGALLVHAGANLINEYADHESGADPSNPVRTPFSGGSGTLEEGLLAPRAVLAAAVLAFAGGSAAGLYLNAVTGGTVILVLGVLGVALGWTYSARPLQLGYRGRGFGELAVALAFGPLIVLGSYYVQTGTLDSAALAVSLPVTVLIALVLIVNGFPDHDGDRAAGKRTLVVTLGRRRSMMLYQVLVAAPFALTVAFVVARLIPSACLLALLPAPLAWKAAVTLRAHYRSAEGVLPANAATVALHGLFGVLLAVGLVVDRVL